MRGNLAGFHSVHTSKKNRIVSRIISKYRSAVHITGTNKA